MNALNAAIWARTADRQAREAYTCIGRARYEGT